MLPDEPPPSSDGDTPHGSTSDGGPAARSSAPIGGALSDERTAALRTAFAAHARGDGLPPEALRDLLRDTGAEARARGLTAERLLVEFKLLWYAIPEVRALQSRRQSEMLGELVTLCIREYYA